MGAVDVCLAGEKNKPSSLLAPSKSAEKMYKIDEHVTSVVAGLTADANILIQNARVNAQRYTFTYQESMPVYLSELLLWPGVSLCVVMCLTHSPTPRRNSSCRLSS
jgi:hypothetical protein